MRGGVCAFLVILKREIQKTNERMEFMLTEDITIDSVITKTVQQVLEGEIEKLKEDIYFLLNTSNKYSEYMKLKDASKYLDVSLNTLKRYISEYDLAITKIDGIQRISKSDLDVFMLSHRS